MKITVSNMSQGAGPVVVGTCPHCGHQATFGIVSVQDLYIHPETWLGQRVCPNPRCKGHIFYIARPNEDIRFYPPAKIRFDSKNVPTSVSESLEEAIECHSHGNHRAAAVMIRRAIDHICQDKQANGNNLEKRIESLQQRVILPPGLFAGLQTLRMLGNDAAHTEAKVFDEIGPKEVTAGIEFVKRVTEAVYQYQDLLDQLEALKKK